MEQSSLFDPVYEQDWPSRISGYAAKVEGVAKALQPDALAEWKIDFKRAVEEMANAGAVFTSEDVIERVGLPRGQVKSNANNAVGAMMNALAKRGVICKTAERRPSRRPSSHHAELAVWAGVQR